MYWGLRCNLSRKFSFVENRLRKTGTLNEDLRPCMMASRLYGMNGRNIVMSQPTHNMAPRGSYLQAR